MNNINTLLEIVNEIGTFNLNEICKAYEIKYKDVLSISHKIVIMRTLEDYFSKEYKDIADRLNYLHKCQDELRSSK